MLAPTLPPVASAASGRRASARATERDFRDALEIRDALACEGRRQGTRGRPGEHGGAWRAWPLGVAAPKNQHRRAPPRCRSGAPLPPRAPASTLRTQPTAEHQRTQSQTRLASEVPRLWGGLRCVRMAPLAPGNTGHPPASPGNGFHVLNQQSLYRYTYYVALGARTSIVKTSAAKTICCSDTLQPREPPTQRHTHGAHTQRHTYIFHTPGTRHTAQRSQRTSRSRHVPQCSQSQSVSVRLYLASRDYTRATLARDNGHGHLDVPGDARSDLIARQQPADAAGSAGEHEVSGLEGHH